MSYEVAKREMGHEPVYVIEMDIDFCTLAFSVGLCSATPDPSNECFNTFGTCPVKQDYSDFGRGTKIYRFASQRVDVLQIAGDTPTFPTIMSVSMAPTKLTPGQGFGVRSSVSITLQDHPWTDVGVDPYLSGRNYDADEQGTFWGKWIARNQFYENREIRVLQGFLDSDGNYDSANMISRTYVINKISGPSADGKVQIEAKDPLKFADAIKSQWPQASKATMKTDITNAQLSFDITDEDAQIFNAFTNDSQLYFRSNDEIFKIATIVSAGGDDYTVTVGARGGSSVVPSYYTTPIEADDHKADSNLQLCWEFVSEPIDELVFFLLNTASGINSSFLPLAKWTDTIDSGGLTGYLLSTLLAEPVSVKDMLQEITEYTIFIFWHEREQEVIMGNLLDRNSMGRPTYNDTDNFIRNSIKVTKDVSQRISEVWVYFGMRNPILPMDESKNFNNLEVTADLSKEGEDSYGKAAIAQFFSRWFSRGDRAIVNEITQHLLIAYKDTKDLISISLDPKDDSQWTGDRIQVQSQFTQDSFGAPKSAPYLILQVNERLKPSGTSYTYLLQSEVGNLGRFGRITPDLYLGLPFPDYSASPQALKDRYAYIAPDSEVFADGTTAYQIS